MTHIQLSAPEAQMLTDHAIQLADELARTLVALHDGNGHKALGYKTWTAYCEAHFDVHIRTIQRYIKQERAREALAGHDSLSRFTGEALEQLTRVDADTIRQVADIAARSETGRIGVEAVKAVQAAITETMTTGAVDIDGEQYAVGDALVASVRSVMREDVLSKREYLAAKLPCRITGFYEDGKLSIDVTATEDVFLKLRGVRGYISIWREQ
jgi:hypothetical protein